MTTCDSLIMNIMSEPYAGKPHVRFDEEGGNPTLTLRFVDGMGLYGGYFAPGGTDASGLWKITEEFAGDSRGPYSGVVCAEENDTLPNLAEKIKGDGGNSSLLSEDASAVPGSDVDISVLLEKLEEKLRDEVINLIPGTGAGSLKAKFPGKNDKKIGIKNISAETLKIFFNNPNQSETKNICDYLVSINLIYLQAINNIKPGLYGSYNAITKHLIGFGPGGSIKADMGYFQNHPDYLTSRREDVSSNLIGANTITVSEDSFYSFDTGIHTKSEILDMLVNDFNEGKKTWIRDITRLDIVGWDPEMHIFYEVHQVGEDGLNQN